MAKQRIIHILLIVILCFTCYFNALSAPFIWDDVALVKDNALIKDVRHLGKIFSMDVFSLVSSESVFYRPLQTVTYMLDYHIWKLNPLGYHLTNIILQILAAILVYLFIANIMLQATGYRPKAKSLQLAAWSLELNFVPLITALLFAVHPINVETVTYISGRADILVAISLLSGMIFFIRGAIWLSLFFFLCGLLSKELALIFPLLILLYIFYFKPQAPKDRRLYFLLLFLLSCAYLFLRINLFAGRQFFIPQDTIYKSVSFFLAAPLLYLKTLFFPINLHMSYTVVLPRSIWEPAVLIYVSGLSAIIFLIIALFRRQKLISFGLIWFLFLLLPHLGILPLNAYFAEHFCYLAAIGIFLIIAIVLVYLTGKNRAWVFWAVFLVVIYGAVTAKYNFVWQDPARFYQRIIKFSPASFTAYNNLGFVEEERGNYAGAAEYYLKAVNIKPDFEIAFINLLRAIYLSGREEAAINRSRGYISQHSGSYLAWVNLGSMYAKSGRYPEAIEAYRKALSIKPNIPDYHHFIGLVYFEQGNWDLAIGELKQAIVLDDKNFAYHHDLALCYKNKGELDLAIKEYLIALGLDAYSPQANFNLGIAYSLSGDLEKAGRSLLKSVKLDNNSALAHYNLGVYYFNAALFDEARREFEAALKLAPGFRAAEAWRDEIDKRKH